VARRSGTISRLSANRAETAEPEFLRCARAFQVEFDYVYRALRRHGVRHQDARDLVQEVFLVMWRRWQEFDDSRQLRPWLAGIAFKVAHSHHRRFARREIPSDQLDPAADTPGPEDELTQSRTRELVLVALERLPEKYRSVLVLHDLDGIPVREIAELAELPRFTVHTRLRRARAQLREHVRLLETGPAAGRARAAWPVLVSAERRPIAAPPEARQRFQARLETLRRAPLPSLPHRALTPRPWATIAAVTCIGLGLAVVMVAARPDRPARRRSPAQPISSALAPERRTMVARARGPLDLTLPVLPTRAPAAAIDVGAGLVGHWSFDDLSGSAAARDLSGRGHDCLLRAIDGPEAWVPGRAGGAVALGTKGWLECPQPAAVGRGPVALTVALWINRQRPHTASTLVDRSFGPGAKAYFHFALRGNTLQLWSGLWSRTTTYELESLPAGWVHLAFTHAGRTTKIFVDGALVAQRDDTPVKSPGTMTSAPVVVGALVKDAARPWQHLDGAIDELRLYDRAVSNDEIAALASLVPP
jgi:RNA polymerase sigma factor (sigma-70 family)